MRTTKGHLTEKMHTINRTLGTPEDSLRMVESLYRHNVGHHQLDHDSTGYQLERITTENGCTRAIINGRFTAGQMAHILDAFTAGVMAERQTKEGGETL